MTGPQAASGLAHSRLQLRILGAVQGVGFRPFVYQLANELGLLGWVSNTPQGVRLEVEGSLAQLEAFQSRLHTGKPAHSHIQSCEASWLNPVGYDGFVIRDSEGGGERTTFVLPDIATCPDCLGEINDPANRRYRYPFTNCTHCGPRFSIIESLPYDRANTSMREFTMCPECAAEYHDPRDRRFHAQPNACPHCGPHLELWPGDTAVDSTRPPRSLAKGHDALLAAAHVVRCGQMLAAKGIGGFHLMVDARNEAAVQRLRDRKHREEKPLAVLFPTLESVKNVCEVSPLEERLLTSPEAPIVLLKKRSDGEMESWCVASHAQPHSNTPSLQYSIAPGVAPGNPHLGAMLPSNPLHHLLLAELGFPVVATSGNLNDEPICTDEREALTRLHGIADVFLVHNRPIIRHVDDSIVRVMAGREMLLRRARGFAPLPIPLPAGDDVRSLTLKPENLMETPHVVSYPPVLAVGAHLKNSVALAVGEQAFVSQHIGDLETEPAHQAFQRVTADLQSLYAVRPDIVVADLHPDYFSTRSAEMMGGPTTIKVQHHVAHVLSCLAENQLEPPALGVAWDGTGLGLDGSIWGGEFFLVTRDQVERVAHLRPFRLPGGDSAVKEPRRAALGLLHELASGDDNLWLHLQPKVARGFTEAELTAIHTMLQRGINAPWTSSIGRLFDAVASLIGLRHQMRFEGQAAMELEFALNDSATDQAYPLALRPRNTQHAARILDWAPMLRALLDDVARNVPPALLSAKFHNALVEGLIAVAKAVGETRVALSGGCFQNRYLTERAIQRLQQEGFQPCWHQRVPPNDGGIALGQIAAARRGQKVSRGTQHESRQLTCV